jgi:trehalose 6-phosphate phosphatase
LIYAFSTEGTARLDAVLASDPLLAFDIDGTLAPIVEQRHEARLPDEVQQGLAQLAARSEVAIITGRSVADAQRMLSFAPRYLIGNHGAEGLRGWRSRSVAFATTVSLWRTALAARPGLAANGVAVEDKTYSLSLHYRQAANPAAAHREILASVAALQPAPRVITGKAVVNLLPSDAPDKGEALFALMQRTQRTSVLYVGDDDTDETVFQLKLPNVLTLRVEPAADSAALLFLRDQHEVLMLVRHIVRRLLDVNEPLSS